MKEEITAQLAQIFTQYDPALLRVTADKLRDLWLQFEPKSIDGIKAELREKQETIGIPVPVLKHIGKGMSKMASNRVDEFIPLMRLLWDEYGREGRVVGLIPLGSMELVEPERLIPLLHDMCRTCISWEDADRLAMDALEPIVRKNPEQWLQVIEPWLRDENMWVKRAGVIVVGRLPMKHPGYTTQCLELIEQLLFDEDVEVKKAVSFAIRLCARGEIDQVLDFLRKYVPPGDPAATWVLCDIIRSMTKAFLQDFLPLLPLYQEWASDPSLTSKDRRSVESALSTLRKSQV